MKTAHPMHAEDSPALLPLDPEAPTLEASTCAASAPPPGASSALRRGDFAMASMASEGQGASRRLATGAGLWLCALSLGGLSLGVLSEPLPALARGAAALDPRGHDSTASSTSSAFPGEPGQQEQAQVEPSSRWIAQAGERRGRRGAGGAGGAGSGSPFESHALAPSVSAAQIPTPSRARLVQAPRFPAPTLSDKAHLPASAQLAGASRRSRPANGTKPTQARTPLLQAPASVAALRERARRLAQAARTSGSPRVQVLVGTQPQSVMHDTPVAALPAAQSAPPISADTLPELQNLSSAQTSAPSGEAPDASEALASLPATRRIIQASALKLPTAGELPAKYRERAVSADTLAPSPAPLPRLAQGERRAQNPKLPPIQPAQPVTNSDRLPNQIEVSVSTFVVLLTTTDLQTVAIADPTIADVAVVNSRAVLVNGKAPGVTSLVVVDRNKIRQYQVRVTSAPGRGPADITTQIGLPGVSVRQAGDALVIEGEVSTADESRRAGEVAGAYSAKIINQLVVRETGAPALSQGAQIQEMISLPNVRVRTINDVVFLDGTVETQAEFGRAEAVARGLSKNVVNLITLPRITVEQARDAITGQAGEISAVPFGPPPLSVRQVGDQIILSGTVPNQAAIDQAIASAGRTGLQVQNQLTIATAPSAGDALTRSVEAAIGRPGVTVAGSARRLILQGIVPDSNASVIAVQIARAFAPEVDNMLQVSNPIQVNVDISFVEINNSAARNLGIQIGSVQLLTESLTNTPPTVVQGTAGTNGQVGTPPVILPGSTNRATTLGTVFRQGAFGAGQSVSGALQNLDPFRLQLNALYNNNNARLLSNPKMTVISGRTGTFQVGGQVPVPAQSTSNAAGTTTAIEFKDYGILMDITPIANADGITTMRIRTEVSAPDFSNGITLSGGGTIPGFTRRSVNTEVTFKPGSTLALSGLVQNNLTRDISRVPILSRIPILGKLFQSKRFQRSESELIIFVRPTVIANTLAPGQTAPGGAVAADNTFNLGTTLGNPGIGSFNTGTTFQSAGSGGGTSGGGG